VTAGLAIVAVSGFEADGEAVASAIAAPAVAVRAVGNAYVDVAAVAIDAALAVTAGNDASGAVDH
jgi:hypothetical protein